MQINSVGSICSGIESASVAWKPLGLNFDWFSEIAPFPSKLLSERYPDTPNLGDMSTIVGRIIREEIQTPDLICGGTPCQAFSFAGYKKGLEDDRGNLTLTFLDILDANDTVRHKKGQDATIMVWENVVGVLSDKTNAFGCFLAQLTGVDYLSKPQKWPQAGAIHGIKRNVAWRVLDAKYFGVPQQRKRIYVVAGGTDFFPENILFDTYTQELATYPKWELSFEKEGSHFEVFREYTDCIYAAYGTKWNGNAAAYNGSLFVVQDQRLRRFSILEVERLMGFSDHYTQLEKASNTVRYTAVGNAWAVPVITYIGERLLAYEKDNYILNDMTTKHVTHIGESKYFNFELGLIPIREDLTINCTTIPSKCTFKSLKDIVTPIVSKELYISSKGAQGILRRANTKNKSLNPRLNVFLLNLSSVGYNS